MTALWRHPLASAADLDDPQTTAARREIIRTKPFLRKIYRDWYDEIIDRLPEGDGRVLEIGSGAGFLKEVLQETVTSELLQVPGVDMCLDATALPIADASLRAIVMTNVLHHLQNVETFFVEAARTVRPGGALVMIEPWVTPWARFVYRRLHHEPFQPDAPDWTIPATGPLSGANSALPWILFARDRTLFERKFPEWRIDTIRLSMPFRYLLSGGVSMRSLMPGWAYGPWRTLERYLSPIGDYVAMFALIALARQPANRAGHK